MPADSPFASLDYLIDEFIRWEAQTPEVGGFPEVSPTFAMAGENRAWDTLEERLRDEVGSVRMMAMEGAWYSLDGLERQALLVDRSNRLSAARVFRVPGQTAEQTAAVVATAKGRLIVLLLARNVIV